jgi:Family of unknown function (DUF5681)
MILLLLWRCAVASSNESLITGYGKPPKHTQFVKGRSGNPKGRPRGSQNLATLLNKAMREKVKVTINGSARYVSKLQAILMQLTNKAASGDPRAIREVLYWSNLLAESQQDRLPAPEPSEADERVMASIVERIRQSEIAPAAEGIDSKADENPGEK